MWLLNAISGGFILLLGVLVRAFNLSGLIAGYNTASKKEKARYNERALTGFVGLMLVYAGGVLIIGGLLMLLGLAPIVILYVSWSLFAAILIAGAVYTNVSPRIKSRKSND